MFIVVCLMSSSEGLFQHVGFTVSVMYNIVVYTTPTLALPSMDMFMSLLSSVTKHTPSAAYGEVHVLHNSLRVTSRRR